MAWKPLPWLPTKRWSNAPSAAPRPRTAENRPEPPCPRRCAGSIGRAERVYRRSNHPMTVHSRLAKPLVEALRAALTENALPGETAGFDSDQQAEAAAFV